MSLRLVIATVLLIAGVPAAQAASALPHASAAKTLGETSIPYGWVDFCGRRPSECEQPALPARDVKLTDASWKALDRVNRQVNASIEPVSNLDHWGTILDHWDYPTDGKGDCKIFALAKRKQLIDAGFPRQALLMTIVRDLEGQGHAILTVATDRGDFVLDNLSDDIRPWTATGYRFVKRQSREDPNVWVAIDMPDRVSSR
ncbi:putative transglutaminase-like cysteine proteinase [Rhodoblastus acidophilus]|uniref:transglutaminase-like cysteine peptidase n=1 Tax=Rhodoblastus acidophilus TaxID=1074 RepID=UPI00222555A0|nr:transglutaminase-like cysteine peptidase [Rhodoblastus acidophilus]MCW2285305.1 putative transglutaminase-like cysteine proteinase [Rhodoblastus acidophilus]MCW2334261.1 putative transglutaminase-like cysteine proteinase [Rhodoblastus acidophilus]